MSLIQPTVVIHEETCYSICTANQMTGFYMKSNTGLNLVKQLVFGKILNVRFV